MAKKKKQLTIEEKLEEALISIDEQPYELPDNWEWVSLGGITTVVSGGTPKTSQIEYYKNGQISWLTPKDLSNYEEKYISRGGRNITELGLSKSSAKLMPKNSVLMSSRAPIGYIAIAENELCTNQGFKSFLPSLSYVPDFLYWYLKNSKELIESYSSGTTFKEISSKKSAELPFCIPPLNEQKRIVAKLENMLSKTREAKEKIQEAKETFELRRASILHKAFTGELTAKWREDNQELIKDGFPYKKVKLNSLISGKCQNGIYKPKTAYGDGTPIIRIDSFYDGVINAIDSLKKLRLSKEEIDLYKLFKNDIVINRVNSIQYLGKSGLFEFDNIDCVFESNMMKISINDLVSPKYLIYYLNSNEGLNELRKNAKHAVNQASINQTDVKNTIIPLPVLEEQKEIVRIIEEMLQAEEKAKDLLDMEEQIDLIEKSIFSKAFRGELNTGDENDEPAIELLKRVLKEE